MENDITGRIVKYVFDKESKTNWLQKRKMGLTGSDAAAVLGLSPWKSNVDVWKDKISQKLEEEKYNPRFEYGLKAEKYLIDLTRLDFPKLKINYEEKYYVIYEGTGDFNFCLSTPDALAIDNETEKISVIEIKTSSHSFFKHSEKEIPEIYYPQVLHYFITIPAIDSVILRCYYPMAAVNDCKKILQTWKVFRDDEKTKADIKFLCDEEKKFWKFVEEKKQPPLKMKI
jgi:putative phage-type endonuclease